MIDKINAKNDIMAKNTINCQNSFCFSKASCKSDKLPVFVKFLKLKPETKSVIFIVSKTSTITIKKMLKP